MNARNLKEMYIRFFNDKEHVTLSSSSIVPENDTSVLFTTAGVQPLVPYLLKGSHPKGSRLVNIQKCMRTKDIDEVGDSTHCTFFEMMGNWSIGSYFKKESISWSWEFLTSKEWLNIPQEKIVVAVFDGNDTVPRDMESFNIWKGLGLDDHRIFFLSQEYNWWGPAGETGPCGPDTEIFIDTGKEKCSKSCDPSCNCGKYIEFWNNVFMQYYKDKNGDFRPLETKIVDTGMGVERTLIALNGGSVYDIEIFERVFRIIRDTESFDVLDDTEIRACRIVADHLRSTVFILGDRSTVSPSNIGRGYVLRRLIRRAIRYGMSLDLDTTVYEEVIGCIVDFYKNDYPELGINHDRIVNSFSTELQRFNKTLQTGMKEFEKIAQQVDNKRQIPGKLAFRLFDTFGFPVELTTELAAEKGLLVDQSGFKECFDQHKELSRKTSAHNFKGGLADNSVLTTRLHTATHILHSALKEILGEEVNQKGSNINSERLRFDFSFNRKLTSAETQDIENRVNEIIGSSVEVYHKEMSYIGAKEIGATGLFESKYKETVSVYFIGNYSVEICGGPHVSNTKELGHFAIKKEQSSSAGVRRIRAILS